MAVEVLCWRRNESQRASVQRVKEWVRTIERTTLVLLIILSALALPDSNGNTQLTRLGVYAVTSLSQLLNASQSQEFIQEMQVLTASISNPEYSSRIDVLTDALQAYDLTHTSSPAYWQSDAVYASDQQALIMLLQSHHITGLVDATHREALMHALLDELPDSMRLAYELRPLMAGTQLYRINANDHQIAIYYESVKDQLELLTGHDAQITPLSESELIQFFLHRSGGNIAEALADMAGFLKYMIRGIAPLYDTSQVEWIRTHVLDQLNPDFTYNSAPQLQLMSDEERQRYINMMGIVYHAYGIEGPLGSLSQILLAAGVKKNYDGKPTDINAYKKERDFDVINELPEIFALLQHDYAKIAS